MEEIRAQLENGDVPLKRAEIEELARRLADTQNPNDRHTRFWSVLAIGQLLGEVDRLSAAASRWEARAQALEAEADIHRRQLEAMGVAARALAADQRQQEQEEATNMTRVEPAGRSERPRTAEDQSGPERPEPFVNTPLLAAKRQAFDYPSQANLDALIEVAQQAAAAQRETELRALVAQWREKADERLNPGGGLLKHSERTVATLRRCAAELETMLLPAPPPPPQEPT